MNHTRKNLSKKSILLQLIQLNTRSYSLHVSSDNFYSSLSNNIDKLIEILFGNSRLPLFSTSIYIGAFSDKVFFSKLNSFKKLIFSLKSIPNIDNICDDIGNDIDHFIYFYSFKN